MADKPRLLQVTRIETQVFGAVSTEQAWTPAVNVYECGNSIQVCVELAGVQREALSVVVEPGRLIIQGRRAVPEPEGQAAQSVRAMEIDHGLFRRNVPLPNTVVLDQVQSTLRDGMLWVVLPLGG